MSGWHLEATSLGFVCGVKSEPVCVDRDSGPAGHLPLLGALGTLRMMGYSCKNVIHCIFSADV